MRQRCCLARRRALGCSVALASNAFAFGELLFFGGLQRKVTAPRKDPLALRPGAPPRARAFSCDVLAPTAFASTSYLNAARPVRRPPDPCVSSPRVYLQDQSRRSINRQTVPSTSRTPHAGPALRRPQDGQAGRCRSTRTRPGAPKAVAWAQSIRGTTLR